MASPSDMEKGFAGGALPSSAKSPVLVEDKFQIRNELEVFQTLVGIHFLVKGGGRLPESEQDAPPPNPLLDIFRPSKVRMARYKNRGLYDRALSQELKNRTLYAMSHYIISGLYLLQILLAATFTALSAYQSVSNVALTVLGALNTIVAGVLAWLMGQGMPVRFRAARDQYRELVKAIEAAERTFAEIDYSDWPAGKRPHPMKERDRLEQMYSDALQDQQANYPESHNSPTADMKNQENKDLQETIEEGKAREKEDKEKLSTLEKLLSAHEQMGSGIHHFTHLPEGSEIRELWKKRFEDRKVKDESGS